jgi:hypothetical protein
MKFIGIIVFLIASCTPYGRKGPAQNNDTPQNTVDYFVDPRCEFADPGFTIKSDVVCSQSRVVSENPKDFIILSHNYGVDTRTGTAHHIYGILTGSHATTFEVLSYNSAHDKNQAYFGSRLIKDADASTFVHVHGDFNKDRHHVYAGDEIFAKADPSTFEKIVQLSPLEKNRTQWTFFYKDAFRIFDRLGRDLADYLKTDAPMDPAGFLHYGGWFVKVNGAVYWKDSLLPSVNPDTFQFLDCFPSRVANPAGIFIRTPPPSPEFFCYGSADGEIVERTIRIPES